MTQMRPLLGNETATSVQLLSHEPRQTLFQFTQPLCSFAQLSPWVPLIETTLQPNQALAALLDSTLPRRRQALLNLVDTLCSLAQSNAWMQLIQSSIEPQ